MIVAFSHTTRALVAGAKTVTRREWATTHARHFREGMRVDAYDRLPRSHGKRVGIIRVTAAPRLESTAQIPDADWEAEGFAWMTEHGTPQEALEARVIWDAWHAKPHVLWVMRFELLWVASSSVPLDGSASSGAAVSAPGDGSARSVGDASPAPLRRSSTAQPGAGTDLR